MEILLVRHGLAERPTDDFDDQARPLSDPGRRRLRRTAQTLDKWGLQPDRILCSPWRRAVETADVYADQFGLIPEPVELLARSPGQALLTMLSTLENERVALVGHQPWLSELLVRLAFGEAASAFADHVRIKKSGFALLRGEPEAGCMQLRALVQPERTV